MPNIDEILEGARDADHRAPRVRRADSEQEGMTGASPASQPFVAAGLADPAAYSRIGNGGGGFGRCAATRPVGAYRHSGRRGRLAPGRRREPPRARRAARRGARPARWRGRSAAGSLVASRQCDLASAAGVTPERAQARGQPAKLRRQPTRDRVPHVGVEPLQVDAVAEEAVELPGWRRFPSHSCSGSAARSTAFRAQVREGAPAPGRCSRRSRGAAARLA